MEVTSEDYADSCCLYNCSSSQKTYERVDKNPCNVSIVVSERMEPPIYLYYRLSNYYQNHRRYVRSRDDLQLKGTTVAFEDLAETDSCHYHVSNSSTDTDVDKHPANIINPCGLIAFSYFNDSFALYKDDGAPVALDETGIAWPSDLEYKFKNNPDGSTGQHFPAFAYERQQTCSSLNDTLKRAACEAYYNDPDNANVNAGWCFPGSTYCVEDEHFAVWMRAAGLPQFRKLWARIHTPLEPGTYSIRVSNGVWKDSSSSYENFHTGEAQSFLYPVSSFSGTKKVVLSTTTWIGGKNYFLGYAYLVVGVICVVLSVCFLIKHRLSPRDLGSASYITWQAQTAKDK